MTTAAVGPSLLGCWRRRCTLLFLLLFAPIPEEGVAEGKKAAGNTVRIHARVRCCGEGGGRRRDGSSWAASPPFSSLPSPFLSVCQSVSLSVSLPFKSRLWCRCCHIGGLVIGSVSMPPKGILCSRCYERRAAMKRPRNGELLCQECFFQVFETEVHETITREKLFERGDLVASGASGGKDSTVLMHVMCELNRRYDYGITLQLLSIDEGIRGYRDDSLETVKQNSEFYKLPLTILSYADLYGWTMDDIVRVAGLKNSCTFCGVFRRQALERGATLLGATKIITGHNADDLAETILMNMLRSDAPRLSRCTQAITPPEKGVVPRVKPFKYAYEKEIVLYAHFKKLRYFTTECTYSKEAFRGTARALIKDLEAIQPQCIANLIYSAEHLAVKEAEATPQNTQCPCTRCGHITSQTLCRACVLLKSLEACGSDRGDLDHPV